MTRERPARAQETPSLADRDLDCRELMQQPIFCFTSDIDWASEVAVEGMLQLFGSYGVPLTPFVTHDSQALRKRFATPENKARVGLHPNFLPGSTHGSTVAEVIDHVQRLWPEARGFRSHSFYDQTHVTQELFRHGLGYDSNLCLWLQPNCLPLRHGSGLVRFPVFWEDDIHFGQDHPFDIKMLVDHLDRPGLKVINVHPIHVALNVPSNAFYQQQKSINQVTEPERWNQAAFKGRGTRTLLTEMLEHIRKRGHQTQYLVDVFLKVTNAHADAKSPVASHRSHVASPPHLMSVTEQSANQAVIEYQTASADTRAEIVRSIYDHRDTKKVYATSPDFHLRELEIDFLAENLRTGKVLDLGCGNGYTLLSLARRIEADYLGVDFSTKMLEGAASLMQEFADELKSVPTFQHADVRALKLPAATFDFVLTERCLLNLPSRDDQWQTIREIHRVLKPGGVYLMVEGTEDGLDRLNRVREPMGLEPIPSVAPDNVSALKFREQDLEAFLSPYFAIEKKHYFGLYYLISRVVHPLLVAPAQPKFDNPINAIARKLCETFPCDMDLGHVVGYKLIAKK